MNVLVVIVTYNGIHWLKKCLDSVLSSSISTKVFIIDNGSIDGTQDFISKEYPEVIFVQSKGNLGFGKANNIGLQYALEQGFDYVYLLNQDAWVMPDTIQRLVDCHNRNPQFGILSPFQLEANMKNLDLNFNKICAECVDLINDLYLDQLKDVYSVDTVMAAHWLISRECLLKVGGFSPTFPHYGEDVNYTNRTWYYGLKVGIVPQAKAVHDRSNREKTIEQKIYIEYIGMLVVLSEIYKAKSHKLLRIMQRALRIVVIYKSFKGFINLAKVLFSYKRIHRNRLQSLSPKSFLH